MSNNALNYKMFETIAIIEIPLRYVYIEIMYNIFKSRSVTHVLLKGICLTQSLDTDPNPSSQT